MLLNEQLDTSRLHYVKDLLSLTGVKLQDVSTSLSKELSLE